MTAEPFGVDELVAIRRAEQQVAPDLQFADLRITATTDGFVVQMVAAGTVEGVEVRVPACLVARVAGGLVTGFEEYADGRAAKPLLRALMPHLAR